LHAGRPCQLELGAVGRRAVSPALLRNRLCTERGRVRLRDRRCPLTIALPRRASSSFSIDDATCDSRRCRSAARSVDRADPRGRRPTVTRCRLWQPTIGTASMASSSGRGWTRTDSGRCCTSLLGCNSAPSEQLNLAQPFGKLVPTRMGPLDLAKNGEAFVTLPSCYADGLLTRVGLRLPVDHAKLRQSVRLLGRTANTATGCSPFRRVARRAADRSPTGRRLRCTGTCSPR